MAFSTPLICCSSGVITVSAMVLGEAPGYCPLTPPVGGTISGYSVIGSDGMASRPAAVITMASAVAKIGRSMKNEEMFTRAQSLRRRRRGGCTGRDIAGGHRDRLWCHGDAWMYPLRPADDDNVSGLQSLAHDAQSVDHSREFDPAIFDLVVGSQQQHVFLILIGVDRGIIDQDRRVLGAAE